MENARRENVRTTELLLLIAVVIWAANYSVAKYGLSGLDASVFNGIRYAVATLLLLLVFFVRSSWAPVRASDWPKLLGAGLVASVVYQIAFVSGLSMTTAGNAAVLLSTSLLWTILVDARMHAQKIRPRMWWGMALSLCGVIAIIVGSGERLAVGDHAIYGDVVCVAAAALWALGANLQKPLLTRYSPMQLALILTGVGGV